MKSEEERRAIEEIEEDRLQCVYYRSLETEADPKVSWRAMSETPHPRLSRRLKLSELFYV